MGLRPKPRQRDSVPLESHNMKNIRHEICSEKYAFCDKDNSPNWIWIAGIYEYMLDENGKPVLDRIR